MPDHCDEAYQLDEGDDVTITTDEGETISGTVGDKSSHHDDHGASVTEQTLWNIEGDDGETYAFGRLDGLSGTPGESPFPQPIGLHRAADEYRTRVPERDQLGFIASVE